MKSIVNYLKDKPVERIYLHFTLVVSELAGVIVIKVGIKTIDRNENH